MYTRLENHRILIALLKKYGIKHLVLSAGQSNYPFVHSVEEDPYFTCYSVVDERSAAFFALGIAQEVGEPVAISCTASTACCNYYSAVVEAYYQKIPLLVLTSDRDLRRRGQLDNLTINQDEIYGGMCKKEVVLPDINSDGDRRYCVRMINEALIELTHRDKGPVHINMPSYMKNNAVDVEELPEVPRIYLHETKDYAEWAQKAEVLKKAKRIMVVCGQHDNFTEEEYKYMDMFHERYNCVFVGEHTANMKKPYLVNMNPILATTSGGPLQALTPDVFITLGTHSQIGWFRYLQMENMGEHWSISENGALIDSINKLTDTFECTVAEFFKYFAEAAPEQTNDKGFESAWKKASEGVSCPELPLSHVFAIQQMAKRLPEEGLLHMSIQNSVRLMQYFNVSEKMKCYCNLGALGIDGSMSTFLGQATASDKPAYLLIGDLSFFYDMNSLRIRHVKKNVHIMLQNNGGGVEFYQNNGNMPWLDAHTSAKHNAVAKAWAESCGFKYYEAHTKEELMNVIDDFMGEHEQPVLLEVFTDLASDADALRELHKVNAVMDPDHPLKACARKLLGPKGVELAKDVMGILRK